MTPVIFYSWQSDRPNRVNRSFIERSLQAAVKVLKKQATTFSPPRVDSDVKGTTGAVKIADEILAKIDDCSAFVADVTPLPSSSATKRITPNPNVLVELGYAAKTIGWDRVILVLNSAYGKAEDLPFDVRGRLTLTYCAPEAEQDLKAVRGQLEKEFEGALRTMLSKPFSHSGTLCFLDDTLALEVSVNQPNNEEDTEPFEKRVVLLPIALKGPPRGTLMNIDCYLDFPVGMKPEDKRGLKLAKKMAESPTADALIESMFPKKSTNLMATVIEEVSSGLRIQRPLSGVKPEHPSPETATLAVDGQQARLHIKKLKSNLVHVLPEIYVIVDPVNAAFPAVIRCRVSTDKGESIGRLTLHAKSKE